MDFRQVEPRGDGGEVEEKLLFFKFINDKNVIWSSQHLVRQPGRLVRSLWLAAHSWKPRVAYFGCWARIGKWKWILRRQPVNSSLYNIRSFCTFYHQYLMRSRLTRKCSSANIPNSERQPLIAVKRDNIQHEENCKLQSVETLRIFVELLSFLPGLAIFPAVQAHPPLSSWERGEATSCPNPFSCALLLYLNWRRLMAPWLIQLKSTM